MDDAGGVCAHKQSARDSLPWPNSTKIMAPVKLNHLSTPPDPSKKNSLQDLSNTVWAFASAGECCADLLDAVAEEACGRAVEFGGQHLAMARRANVGA